MTTDIYLRADDRDSLDAVLWDAGLIDGDGRPVQSDILLTRISTLWRPTGEIDGDGMPVTETVAGYHANLRLLREPTEAEVSALDGVTIPQPANPFRVWFD
ncbi:hypothetical protein [Sphingomonas sp. SRS2]|uniref:hypothetical protein n=1 Tax=Sphingomonas sp. SRS2 TaxID=133190 RepID=UPI0006183F49|nr:hypothetical protein [Sphingomonas sp. SRS2]KKC24450.1 hypothetical protein WP12_19355 [Sphingomonas sp. SRS2]